MERRKTAVRAVILALLLLVVLAAARAGCVLAQNSVAIYNRSGSEVRGITLGMSDGGVLFRRSLGSLGDGASAVIRYRRDQLYVQEIEFTIGNSTFSNHVVAGGYVGQGELCIMEIMPDGTVHSRYGSFEEVLLSGFPLK